jgi:hypothetical protein
MKYAPKLVASIARKIGNIAGLEFFATGASARAGRALTRMRLFAASVGADVAALYSIPSGRDYATPLSGRVSVSRRVRCA